MLDLPPEQIICIAQAVYGEARGESEIGKRGVVHVILNRSKKRKLTPCQIVRQHGQFFYKTKNSYFGADWNNALEVAKYPKFDVTKGAMFFHSVRVRPRWKHRVTIRIGNHIFYK